jgi:hypothetical protein
MATEKRLIDANALISKARRMETTDNNGIPLDTFAVPVIAIEDAPTVDAVEVVHGRWEDVFKGNCAWERYKCSVCGGYALYRHEQVFDEWKTVQVLANYCPYCGAYMENGEENGEM